MEKEQRGQIIRAENIFKNFSDTEVLKGVGIFVDKGEIVAIVGASGAGKSTLLQILGSLETPSDTARHNTVIEINGQNILGLKGRELAKFRNKNIGFVFQNNQLLPEFTAEENVAIPYMIAGKGLKEAKVHAAGLLDMLGIKERAGHKPSELSGGEQQRVAIARALVNSPSIIFADEPSGNLDEKNAAQLHDIITGLNKDLGTTFVIVTHSRQLAALASRSFIMERGLFI